MERQCFQHMIQDVDIKCRLFDTLVTPTVMYAAESWCPSMLSTDWAQISRLQISMLSRMIRAKPSVPHQIILAEFATPPIQLEAIFRVITFVQRSLDLQEGRYPRAALTSSRHLHDHGFTFSWFSATSRLFQSLGLSLDDLPSGTHDYIRGFLFRAYMQRVWQGSLSVKLLFYHTHFLQTDSSGCPIMPLYLSTEISFGLRFRIGQLRVSSHQLFVETGRYQGLPREARICTICTLQEVEDEQHFLFHCPVYYEIRGRYHCLFRDQPSTLRDIISYEDPRCLGLMIREMLSLRGEILTCRSDSGMDQYLITDFFTRRRKREPAQDLEEELRIPVMDRQRHRHRCEIQTVVTETQSQRPRQQGQRARQQRSSRRRCSSRQRPSTSSRQEVLDTSGSRISQSSIHQFLVQSS